MKTTGKMMICFAVLGILIFIFLWSNSMISSLLHDFSEPVDEIIAEVEKGNWANAKKSMDEMETLWQERKKMFSIVLEHNLINNIDLCINNTATDIITQDYLSFRRNAESIKQNIEDAICVEDLTWENVF